MFSAPKCLVKIILGSKHNFDKKVFKGHGLETQVMVIFIKHKNVIKQIF